MCVEVLDVSLLFKNKLKILKSRTIRSIPDKTAKIHWLWIFKLDSGLLATLNLQNYWCGGTCNTILVRNPNPVWLMSDFAIIRLKKKQYIFKYKYFVSINLNRKILFFFKQVKYSNHVCKKRELILFYCIFIFLPKR